MTEKFVAGVEGFSLSGRTFYDDFNRADNTNLASSLSASGYSWITTGANLPRISSNRMVLDPAGSDSTGYAEVQVDSIPIRQAGVVSFAAGGGNNGNAVAVLICGLNFNLTDMVHFFTSQLAWTLQLWVGGTAFTVAQATYAAPIPTDGVGRLLAMEIDGNQIRLTTLDGRQRVLNDDRVRSQSGAYLIYELSKDSTSPVVRFDYVDAQESMSVGSLLSTWRGGHPVNRSAVETKKLLLTGAASAVELNLYSQSSNNITTDAAFSAGLGISSLSISSTTTVQEGNLGPSYSASITPNYGTGAWQSIGVTNSSAFTINAPTNPPNSSHTGWLTIEISNQSGGAMGAITWNPIFRFAGKTWTNPASGQKRAATFRWNGSAWVCTDVSTADYA